MVYYKYEKGVHLCITKGGCPMWQILFVCAGLAVVCGSFWTVSFAQTQNDAQVLFSIFLVNGSFFLTLMVGRLIIRRQTLGEMVKFNELDRGSYYRGAVNPPELLAIAEEISCSERILRLVDATSITKDNLLKIETGKCFKIRGGEVYPTK